MQLTIPKADLLNALTRCVSVADSKSTMPILSNVLLHANGKLAVSATDLNHGVSSAIDAAIKSTGSVAVDARGLLERVKNLPAGDIVITEHSGSVTLKAAGSARRFTVHSVAGEDFPDLPKADGGKRLTLPTADLLGLFTGAAYAISQDETRIHLNSGLLECSGGKLRLVATDGHRLAVAEIDAPADADEFKALIPLKGVLELKRLCECGDDITLTVCAVNLFADAGGFTYSVKLADVENFPPYQQVIPSSTEATIVLPRKALQETLRAVAVAASDRTNAAKFTFSKGLLRIESQSPESGDGFDELAIEYDGPKREIGFCARYVLEALSSFENDTVSVGVSGELDPTLFGPAGGGDVKAVIMPMRA